MAVEPDPESAGDRAYARRPSAADPGQWAPPPQQWDAPVRPQQSQWGPPERHQQPQWGSPGQPQVSQPWGPPSQGQQPPQPQWGPPGQPQRPQQWGPPHRGPSVGPPHGPMTRAGSGQQDAESRPSVPVLLGVTLWRLGIGGAALSFAVDGEGENMSDESLSYLSNLGTGWCYLGLAVYPLLVFGRRHEPRTAWLRGALTIMMLVVGLVFVVGMGEEPDGPHAVIPSLVLIDWLLVGRNQFRTKAWEPLTWIVFLLAYLVYHQTNDVPLYPDILGVDNIGTMVPIMLAGSVVVCYLLYGAAMVRKAVSSSTSDDRAVHRAPAR